MKKLELLFKESYLDESLRHDRIIMQLYNQVDIIYNPTNIITSAFYDTKDYRSKKSRPRMSSDIDLLAQFDEELWVYEVKSCFKKNALNKAIKQLNKQELFLREYSQYNKIKKFIVAGECYKNNPTTKIVKIIKV